MSSAKKGNMGRGEWLLLLAAFIWGMAFVAQSIGARYIGAFTFQCTRNFLGCLPLIPFILFRRKQLQPEVLLHRRSAVYRKELILGSIATGAALTVAAVMQQMGIGMTTVGKSGFITSLYIIFVPVLGIFIGRKTPGKIWLSIGLATIGFYLMNVVANMGKETGGGPLIGTGEWLLLACAVWFAVQILVIDHFVKTVDAVELACGEFLVSGLLSLLPMLVLERPSMGDLRAALLPILYAGLMSSGVAYTLQTVGQREARPENASLLMSLESVFSLLGGILILQQIPGPWEFAGCALVFTGVILAQR